MYGADVGRVGVGMELMWVGWCRCGDDVGRGCGCGADVGRSGMCMELM